MKYILILSLCLSVNAQAQVMAFQKQQSPETVDSEEKTALWKELYRMDSLLFQVGFNRVDTASVSGIISDDLEFYHDKHGVTLGKRDFLQSLIGLGSLPFATTRVLQEESLEVFPLFNDNGAEMYGAIQSGVHTFYQKAEGEQPVKSGVARFTHLWMLEGSQWKLYRVLSFDHQGTE